MKLQSWMMSLVMIGAGLVALNNNVLAQATQTAQVEAVAPAPVSGSIKFELSRDLVGEAEKAMSNTTTLSLTRPFSPDTSLTVVGQVKNTFSQKKRAGQQFAWQDPGLIFANKNLFKVSDVTVSGDLRYFLPLTENSLKIGSDRNPNRGAARYTWNASLPVGGWSFGVTQAGSMYSYLNYKNAKDEVNPDYKLMHIADVGYTLNEVVSFSTSATWISYIRRGEGNDANKDDGHAFELGLGTSVAIPGVKGLQTELGVAFAAPNQNLKKFYEPARDDSKSPAEVGSVSKSILANTSLGLTLAYSFL
ncbi:MAG: hypothetical protein HY390_02035 [Deltaproteobacteria bacterium]|nr:hypothetical protein [Deltaproteobacteria bacterium]